MLSRRSLLISAAPAAAALALAGCTTAQVQQFETQWSTIVGEIQTAVAAAAKYVPTVESIAETAASLFGPEYVTAVTAGSAAFNAIVATLVNVVNNLTPPASARLHARLRASSPSAAVLIGTTPQGVTVTGFKV
jgi:hypothetical protein